MQLDFQIPPIARIVPATAPPWSHWQLKFNLTILELSRSLVPAVVKPALEIIKLHPEALIIYTYVSHSNNFVGCAATTNSEIVLQYSLPPHFTILAAELHATYPAIQHIAAWSQQSQTLVLISDSLSSLKTLQNTRQQHQNPTAKLIVHTLSNMEHTEAVFLWVSSLVTPLETIWQILQQNKQQDSSPTQIL